MRRATRAYHKGWQNRRPGWTRRVRWFEGRIGETLTIRLNFVDMDEHRECNRFYSSHEDATRDYEAFIASEVTVLQLMDARFRLSEREADRDRFARSLEGLSNETFHAAMESYDKESNRR